MATCPVCDADELEVDEYEVDEGDIVNCPECGASLEVTSLSPLEFESAGDDDEDDDDEEEEEPTKTATKTSSTKTRTMMRRETGTTTDPSVGSSVTSAPAADPMIEAAAGKEQALRRLLAGFDSVIVAYSGGVDSAYLAWLAHDVLHERALAVTALSASYPQHHYDLRDRGRAPAAASRTK